ncbi:MAG: hypothetical protein MHM6MM_008649 [Cercozoa sp. M6MM]
MTHWRKVRTLQRTEFYFKILVSVSRVPDDDGELPELRKDMTAAIVLRAFDSSDPLSRPLRNFAKNQTVSLRCDEGKRSCDTILLAVPFGDGFGVDWQNTILASLPEKQVKLEFVAVFNGDLRLPSQIITYHWDSVDQDYRIAEYVLRAVFCCVTGYLILLWVWKLHVLRLAPIVEQRWVLVLYFGLMCMQNPLNLSRDPRAQTWLRIVNGVVFSVATTIFGMFWLAMLRSIRGFDTSVTVPFMALRRSAFHLLFAFMCISGSVFLATYFEWTGRSEDEPRQENVRILLLVSLAVWALCWTLWIAWMLRSFWRAKQTLRFLPYLATRERQLSFRFFKSQTLLVMLFLGASQLFFLLQSQDVNVVLDAHNTVLF